MRIDKFTQKMQEALQAAQDLASQSNHQEITNEHFLLSLLDQSDGKPLVVRHRILDDGVNMGHAGQLSCAQAALPGDQFICAAYRIS